MGVGCRIWFLVLLLALVEARWRSLPERRSLSDDYEAYERRRRYDAPDEDADDPVAEESDDRLSLEPRRLLPNYRWHRKHHRHHRRPQHRRDHVADPLELARETGEDHARGKRHNRLRAWTESDKKSFSKSRPTPEHFDNEKAYEVEVREAQNSSLCNYTVVPIADPGGRVPRELEHVKCNHVGSKCQDKGTYCCIQTYRHVEVMYEGGKRETLKVYSGCVCSLQIYGTLEPYTPEIDVDD